MSMSKTVDKVTKIIVGDILIKPLSNDHILKATSTRNRKLVKVSDLVDPKSLKFK
jgi:hypothetical protein